MKLKMFIDPPIAATLFPMIKGLANCPLLVLRGYQMT